MDSTKIRLANSLKELMKTQHLEKINIKELCSNAYLSRQSFYNYFNDKYELVSWMLDNVFVSTHVYVLEPNAWQENTKLFLTEMKKDEDFFNKAYRYAGQNSLEEHHLELLIDFYLPICEKRKGDKLSREEEYCLRFYFYELANLISRWARQGMPETPIYIQQLYELIMPEIVKKYLCA